MQQKELHIISNSIEEKLFDLFQDKDNTYALNIREDKQEGAFVEGLSEYQVTSVQD